MRRPVPHTVLLVIAAALVAAPVRAQTAADTAAIRAAALDYIDGWYTGDGERMERALHPELAKRIVVPGQGGQLDRLGQQSALTLVQNTRRGYGKEIPEAKRRHDVRILDVHDRAASVRVDAATWIDYLHLAKWNGRWVIVNVLWEAEAQSP